MKQFIIILIFFCILPVSVFGQSNNVGIIQGIWFSEGTFFAGDAIRIYTAIQNNTGDDIEGIIEFFDNDISIGTKDFSSLNRRISEIWIDTVVTEGEHNYSVKITEAAINRPGEPNELVVPRIIESDEIITVGIDTDGDDIGDSEDLDDDNDGFSDEEEQEKGTDPLNEQSVPVTNFIDEIQEESERTIFQEIISALQNSDNKNKSDLEKKNNDTISSTGDIPLPAYIENIEHQYPAVSNITQPLSVIQNVVVPKIHQEQTRVKNRIEIPEDRSSGSLVESIKNSKDSPQITGWKYWMYQIYSWLLLIFNWIFSCIICMILLLFISLHLVLKLFFRMFRRRFQK